MTTTIGTGDAVLDPTGRYRYRLWREWPVLGGTGTVAFIMLNPSTAGAAADDPTIRRCIRYAQAWGYARVEIGNLFAWRATDPRELDEATHPVGPANDQALRDIVTSSRRVVAAWGNWDRKFITARAAFVEEQLAPLRRWYALAVSKSGRPKHPLYMSARLTPTPLEDLRAEQCRP